MTTGWRDFAESCGERDVLMSAPCRVDCGGSTDHRVTGLLGRPWRPATTTIAIDLRTTVRVMPHTPGHILVTSRGFEREEAKIPELPLVGPLGLVFAIVTHFGVHGVRVDINAGAPARSGLGGSGVVAVATIGALANALAGGEGKKLGLDEIALLAHHIEDSLLPYTGLQDQASAAYGNVHLWEWDYHGQLRFTREPLVGDYSRLEDCIVIAYTGQPHPRNKEGANLPRLLAEPGFVEQIGAVSEYARRFAAAIRDGDIGAASNALNDEFELRSMLFAGRVPEDDEALLKVAKDENCGVRFAGHGGGGCIWAIGQPGSIEVVRKTWEKMLEHREAARILPNKIAREGLRIEQT